MKKNIATKWIVFAFDRTDNTPKTGDAANITAGVYIDGGSVNAVDDTNPTELGGGYYIFDITAAECNGDIVVISPASSTTDIQVIGVPGAVWTDAGGALDAAGVRAALGMATADLDTQIAALPTAPENADAVWDEPTIDHTTNATTGEAVQAILVSAGVTPAQVAAAVWATVVTGAVAANTALASLYNGWSASAGAGSGAGAITSEITVNVGGVPADGVEVWITTDSSGEYVIAGTLVTGTFGVVTFMLDAGTYFLWKQKAGVNFTNPETIVVTP